MPTELKGYRYLQKRREHLVGSSRIYNFAKQSVTQNRSGIVTVIVRLCIDLTSTRVINAHGKDVTPSDRDSVVALEMTFQNGFPGSRVLLIADSEILDKQGFSIAACG